MASSKDYLQFVLEQLSELQDIFTDYMKFIGCALQNGLL